MSSLEHNEHHMLTKCPLAGGFQLYCSVAYCTINRYFAVLLLRLHCVRGISVRPIVAAVLSPCSFRLNVFTTACDFLVIIFCTIIILFLLLLHYATALID